MGFTHFDGDGSAIMVDVSGKDITPRRAVAEGHIKMSAECFEVVRAGTSKKGDVLGTARLAGIMAAKRTSGLIPLCHPVAITGAAMDFEPLAKSSQIKAVCTVKTDGRTGVEMEALTGVTAALLTIYDMCKAIDRSMVISGVRLLEKSGGKSGTFRAPEADK